MEMLVFSVVLGSYGLAQRGHIFDVFSTVPNMYVCVYDFVVWVPLWGEWTAFLRGKTANKNVVRFFIRSA
jgi:hypothetical protein